MITGLQFAEQAQSDRYDGIPYSKYDCQAFVEAVARDAGIRKPDGGIYNCKGSNHMWRTIHGWHGTIQACVTEFGKIPLGAWVFICHHDGGEKDRGYTDNLGNFTHVGIYCNDGKMPVRDSTRYTGRDGVGYRAISAFTHVLLPDFIEYQQEPETILEYVQAFRNQKTSDKEWLTALGNILNYLKGD